MSGPDDHPSTDSPTPSLPTRRAFGGLLGTTAATAATAALGSATASAASASATAEETPFRAATARSSARPNFLVVLADDLGWADLSCFGSPTISTPNLDRLARQGVRFTQGYAGSATCSPTRISLYTGRYPGRTEAGLYEPLGEQSGLEPDHPTLASLLREAGYDTALIGKWHCGNLPDHSPVKSGWDTFFGNFGGALEYYSKLGMGARYDLYEGEVTYQDLRYYTSVLTERAADHIRERGEQDAPWLLNLNFTTPHWPWIAEGDEEEAAEIERRIRNGDGGALGHNDGGSLETYAQMVESLDRSVGEVLDALRGSGQERDTLVFFSSDNGGERWSYQWPLSGQKFSLQEGGIRIPQIVRWPARIDGRQVSDVPNFSPDWTATMLELAETEAAPSYPLDGRSMAGYLLRGEDPPERDLFWRVRGERALRRGDWKYHRDEDDRDHLFNLADDPREQAEKSAHEPDLLASMRTAWEETAGELLPYPTNPGPQQSG